MNWLIFPILSIPTPLTVCGSLNTPLSWHLHRGARGPFCAGQLSSGSSLSAYQVTFSFGDNALRADCLALGTRGSWDTVCKPSGGSHRSCASTLPFSSLLLFCESFQIVKWDRSHSCVADQECICVLFVLPLTSLKLKGLVLNSTQLMDSLHLLLSRRQQGIGTPWLNSQRQWECIGRAYKAQKCDFICLKWADSCLWVSVEKDSALHHGTRWEVGLHFLMRAPYFTLVWRAGCSAVFERGCIFFFFLSAFVYVLNLCSQSWGEVWREGSPA